MEQLVIMDRGKKLVHTIIGIRAGWHHERPGERGITHLIEHAVFLGNEQHPAPDAEAAESGISLGGMTLPECTLFYFTSTSEGFARIFPTLLSLIYHPGFDDRKIIREKKEKIITAVIHEADFTPWELAQEWARNMVFDRDFTLSLGTEEELEMIGRRDVQDWHRRYYHDENSFLVVHGNVRADEVAELVEDAEIAARGETPRATRSGWVQKEMLVTREGMRKAEMVYGFRIPEYRPEWEVLSIMLGNYPLSKLWRDEFSASTYTVGSQLEWTSTIGGFFLQFGSNSPDDTAEIDRRLWSLLRSFGVDETEFRFARETRLLDISKMKEGGERGLLRFVAGNPNLRYRDFDEMANEVDRLDKRDVLTISEVLLNNENTVRAVVAGEISNDATTCS